jgi:DNA-binding MarR family transcriptional regulator
MKLEEVLKTERFESNQQKAMLNVMYTAWWAKTGISAILKPYGFTSEQFNVMRILKGKHPQAMCVKDIASRMIEKSSNVPRIIDRMIIKGTAVRSQSDEDRRETLVSLTEAGLHQLEKASAALVEFNQALGLSDEEAELLNSLLERFRAVD